MARAISTRTTRRTRASIRTTSPTPFAGASTTGRPTGGSRPSSAGGSPGGRADGVSRGDVSPTGHARLDLHAMRVPAARGARTPHALRLVPPCRGARQPHRPVDDRGESVAHVPRLRVGVVFGGRSGEHEVSLASAASVIAALERRGHTVVPIGIARDGRWVVGGDPLRAIPI